MVLVPWCLIFKLNYNPNQTEIQATGPSKITLDGKIKLPSSLAGDGGNEMWCCNIQDTARPNKAETRERLHPTAV